MFKLTTSELDCAKAAIDHHGYSTLLPMPPEWDDIDKHWHVARSYLCSLDLERYTPRQSLPIMVAKDQKSVRLIHLLHPEDLILYTSLTLIVKNDVEGARLPRTEQRVYSYRASSSNSRLYDSVYDTHEQYVERLKRKVQRKRTRAVAVTDIADFYASIPHAQLKRLLKSAARTQRVAKAARLLVSVFAAGIMPREGHGIPTGPLASRLLAEILLNEVDKYLLSKRVDFVRWVDDYNFFAPSLTSARNILFDLAAWLYNAGLTLQTAKTGVLDKTTYAQHFLLDIEDKLSARAAILAELMRDDGYETDAEEHAEDFMDDLHAVELLEMLVDAISGEDSIDYRVIGFVARRLLKMTLDKYVSHEVLEVLTENIEQLSPVIAAVAPLIIALLPNGRMPKRLGERLLGSMGRIGLDHYAAWILTIFAERGRRIFLDALTDVYGESKSQVVKRYAVLAILGSGGSVPIKHEGWLQTPPLVRLALLRPGVLRTRKTLKPVGIVEELVAKGTRT